VAEIICNVYHNFAVQSRSPQASCFSGPVCI